MCQTHCRLVSLSRCATVHLTADSAMRPTDLHMHSQLIYYRHIRQANQAKLCRQFPLKMPPGYHGSELGDYSLAPCLRRSSMMEVWPGMRTARDERRKRDRGCGFLWSFFTALRAAEGREFRIDFGCHG
jgi:hypothetical protein